MLRTLAAVILSSLAVAVIPADAAGPCRDQQPSGSTVTIATKDEPGTRMRVSGVVYDAKTNLPLDGVTVYVYHTDAEGYYSANRGMNNRDPRLCGILRTGADGRYTVDTIRPADYATGNVEAHVHFQAWGEGIERQAFLLEFLPRVVALEKGARPPASKALATAVKQSLYRHVDGTVEVRRDLMIRH